MHNVGGTGSIAHAYFLRIVQLHQVLQSSEQYEAFAKPAISFLIRSANNVSRMGSSSRELAPYADMVGPLSLDEKLALTGVQLVGLEGVCAALRCSRFRQSLTTMSEWRLLVGLLLQLLDGMIIPLRSRSIFYCVIEAAILSTPLLSSREQEEVAALFSAFMAGLTPAAAIDEAGETGRDVTVSCEAFSRLHGFLVAESTRYTYCIAIRAGLPR